MDHFAIRKAYPNIVILDDSFVNYGLDASGNKVSIVQSNVYPDIAEQVDQLYHDMADGKLGAAATTGSWYVGITSIKTKFPKP